MKRQCGVLMPIFSLPSKFGIGDFGSGSYKFVDFLAKSGVKIWQILPLVQTGYGNSPYSSVSSESLNPFFISPEILRKKKLVTDEEIAFTADSEAVVDYSSLYAVRFPLLKKAFARFNQDNPQFRTFLRNKEAYDYALYMSLKFASGQKHFYEWDDVYKYRDESALKRFARDYKDELLFWQFVQFEAKSQWLELKKYANSKGISIMGDMPLYVALDSVDVWKNPALFKLDRQFVPTTVAGVPPDYFSADGQLWGNPVYDYDYHKKDDFAWWCQRIERVLKIFDYVRIDHFRGLDRYFEVPYGAENARYGEWVDVPSDQLFEAIHKRVKRDKIVAEDLGIIDDGVRELLKKTGYPGMKILSFAFNGEEGNLYLPQNIEENSVCYTGTHDNDTLKGLIEKFSEWDYDNLVRGVVDSGKKLGVKVLTENTDLLIDSIIRLGFACKANLFILPMQDLLYKDTSWRINEPGLVKKENWSIRFQKGDFNEQASKKLKSLIKKYNR